MQKRKRFNRKRAQQWIFFLKLTANVFVDMTAKFEVYENVNIRITKIEDLFPTFNKSSSKSFHFK